MTKHNNDKATETGPERKVAPRYTMNSRPMLGQCTM